MGPWACGNCGRGLGGGQGGARSARAAPRGHDVATGAGQSPLGGLDRARPLARARETGAEHLLIEGTPPEGPDFVYPACPPRPEARAWGRPYREGIQPCPTSWIRRAASSEKKLFTSS